MTNPYAPPGEDEVLEVGDASEFSYRSTRGLSLVLRALLAITVVVYVLDIWDGITRLDVLHRIKHQRDFTIAEVDANIEQGVMVGVLYLLVLAATAITWIVWQQRTSQNARALGAEYMEYGPKAWGWFFCPIVNLVRPLGVVRELWWVNDQTAPNHAPGFFLAWWLPWVFGSILDNFSWQLMRGATNVDEVITAVQLDLAASACLIVSAIFAIKVVTEVHRREQARARGGDTPHA